MADKPIHIIAGVLTQKEATVVSAGAGDAGEIVALDAAGKLDTSVLPSGLGPETTTVTASENLADGDFVNVWDDAGTPKARKADASAIGTIAWGFVLAAVTSGNPATVYTEGINDHLSGLTAGPMWLSATAGASTATAPSGAGEVVQRVGVAVSATAIAFSAGDPVVLA